MHIFFLLLFLLPITSASDDSEALLQFLQSLTPNSALSSWAHSDPCSWHGVTCLNNRVISLSLTNLNLSGPISPSLANLTNLTHLDLSRNALTGSLHLFSSVADFSALTYFNVSYNKLEGDLFLKEPMPMFDSLEVFDASFNGFGGNVPAGFGLVVSLRRLLLRGNRFVGSLPEGLVKEGSMVLEELDLSSNLLTGPVKSVISTTLKTLNLSSNKLTGPLPARIGSCEVVDFSYNMLSGDLSAVHNWGNYVEVIDLSSNELTGTFPNETSQFLRLTFLNVSNNMLVGELPDVIGSYPEMNTIDFSHNQLHGSIPPSLLTSSRLVNLNLSGNNFVGPIPFPNSSALVALDLSNNSLSGSLPQEISVLNSLGLLNLARNNISGQIPKEIGLLHKLVYLDLSHNNFKGIIPGNLPDGILQLNMSYNDLSGNVPDDLLKFPDSAFHPGNTLLVYPGIPASDVPASNGHRMKKSFIYVLICSFIAFIVLILISLYIYRKASHRTKDTDQQQKAKSPPKSTSFSEAQLLQSRSTSMPHASGDVSFVTKEPKEPDVQEPSEKIDHLRGSCSSPNNKGRPSMSLIISSPVGDPYASENPGVFTVGSPDRLSGDLHIFDNSLIVTAEQLSRAPAECIGRSCHGSSYKASLDSGRVFTVKWLREGIVKSKKEFSREAKKLGTIKHPNIVSLQGYYWGPKEHEKLIISNYINATSLTAHLCESETRMLPPLSLNQRITISVDIARGLNYLHNERAIPHGNLKSTNIILESQNLTALLTDYSLHRILTPGGMADQVLNAGALGYRPPEFASTSKPCPSLKSDVYAFGVILLEILTGKNAGEIVSGNPGIVDITDWVKMLANENRSHECFDRKIQDVASNQDVSRVLECILSIALRCIRSAAERPEINTVFEDLSSISL